MGEYAIVTNRKRAIIALAHSVVFLLIGIRSLATSAWVDPIWMAGSSRVRAWIILFIYLIVSSVLIQLVRVSRCAREKLYFGFCASSASVGLLRAIFGDPNVPAGPYLRVLMLICAVTIGTVILRSHAQVEAALESES